VRLVHADQLTKLGLRRRGILAEQRQSAPEARGREIRTQGQRGGEVGNRLTQTLRTRIVVGTAEPIVERKVVGVLMMSLREDTNRLVVELLPDETVRQKDARGRRAFLHVGMLRQLAQLLLCAVADDLSQATSEGIGVGIVRGVEQARKRRSTDEPTLSVPVI